MKVIKALNNNMVLVRDSSGREMICQGKGIGFQKRAGDPVDDSLTERRFVPETEDDSRYFEQLFSEIPDEYWELAERVVVYGRTHFGIQASERIILPLCDHMAGSVERYRRGVKLANPMLWDIKRIYPKEFKIGRYALDLLSEHYGVEMQEDEAAFLAYHFVTAELGDSSSQVPPDMMTALTGYVVDLIEQTFQIELDEEDWNYQRFLTHLKFL